VQVQAEVQGVSANLSVYFVDLDVEALTVSLVVVFVVLYLWMIWAYIKVRSLFLLLPF
jgi:hypothetical protein